MAEQGEQGDLQQEDPAQPEGEEGEALQDEAREMGWVPEGEFRGDKTRWIDAKSFVERGRSILPILSAQNKGLKRDLSGERQAREGLERRLRVAETALTSIQDAQHQDSIGDIQAAQADVKQKLVDATKEQDADAIGELTDRLVELKLKEVQAKSIPAGRPAAGGNGQGNGDGGDPRKYPPGIKWTSENPWADPENEDFDVDRYYSALAVGHKLRAAQPHLVHEAFYTALDKQLSRQKANDRGRRSDRMESGGGGGGVGDLSGTSYDKLPADAKRECDKQGSSPKLVGPSKIHKTLADYRKWYAVEYFKND